MKSLLTPVLYMALALGANAAFADPYAISDLRDGDMKKLVVHAEPQAVADAPFDTEDGGTATLADYAGKITVVNFWATWCAPCRKEMPMLAELQTELGGDDFEVVTIATGRSSAVAMAKFFEEIGIDNLPLHTDARMGLARAMGVLGLPVTLILDRDGNEVGRLTGDAEWNSDSAKAILRSLIADGGQG